MVLIRLIVLTGLKENVRIFAKHVSGVSNGLADSISRNKIAYFHKLCKDKGRIMQDHPVDISPVIWPLNKIWKRK